MAFIPGLTPFSLPIITTIDVDWSNPEPAERCLGLVGAQTDDPLVLPLVRRVFGDSAPRLPSLVGACPFGGGTNYYKSILFVFDRGPNSLSFSLHSHNLEFREIHERELMAVLLQIETEFLRAARGRPKIRIDVGDFPLTRLSFADALRTEYWIIVPFVIDTLLRISTGGPIDFRSGILTLVVYAIAASYMAWRTSDVFTIKK